MQPFRFDAAGSSHDFRDDDHSKQFIQYGHPWQIDCRPQDSIVEIVPLRDHWLDYYDNQFCKQDREHIVKSILGKFTPQEVEIKLREGWNYREKFDASMPRWILREWASFWLDDLLRASYDAAQLESLGCKARITTQQLFDDLPDTLAYVVNSLGLKLRATASDIRGIQQSFWSNQKWHDIQGRCEDWINNTLRGIDVPCPCLTLFDEAWVQHKLKRKGYEIACDGLDSFPRSSQELSKIIYQNTHT